MAEQLLPPCASALGPMLSALTAPGPGCGRAALPSPGSLASGASCFLSHMVAARGQSLWRNTAVSPRCWSPLSAEKEECGEFAEQAQSHEGTTPWSALCEPCSCPPCPPVVVSRNTAVCSGYSSADSGKAEVGEPAAQAQSPEVWGPYGPWAATALPCLVLPLSGHTDTRPEPSVPFCGLGHPGHNGHADISIVHPRLGQPWPQCPASPLRQRP